MKNSKNMGHFTGWKFGVPVRIYEHNPGGCNYPEYEEARLVNENDEHFMIVFNSGVIGSRSKQNFHYELIPHKAGSMNPRYPICQAAKGNTTYCNQGGVMSYFDTLHQPLKRYPAAIIVIDGKTIELSAETIANIKAEVGI